MTAPPTSESGVKSKQPVPRGIIVIGVLLYVAAAILVATAALPDNYLGGIPRWGLFLGALALGILGTGLFRKRRWAWFASLAFVLVNAFYLYRALLVSGQNQIVGLTVLAIMLAYLLTPGVRAVYLRPPGAQ